MEKGEKLYDSNVQDESWETLFYFGMFIYIYF